MIGQSFCGSAFSVLQLSRQQLQEPGTTPTLLAFWRERLLRALLYEELLEEALSEQECQG